MPKPVYAVAYHQSKFGKLLDMTVPQIIHACVSGACHEIGIGPGSHGRSLHRRRVQFLAQRAGPPRRLVAMVPGMEGKPIEAVENACASGGQAALSVIRKLQAGRGTSASRSATRRCGTTTGEWMAS